MEWYDDQNAPRGERSFPVVVVGIVALGLVLGGLMFWYLRQKSQTEAELTALSEEYEASRQETTEEESDEPDEEQELAAAEEREALIAEIKADYSFYQKLAVGYDVNILILGDSSGLGSGASAGNTAWYSLLLQYLRDTYMAESELEGTVKVKNIARSGSTPYAGYVQLREKSDSLSYDLIILCYGEDGSQEDGTQEDETQELYCEALIREIMREYPGAEILSIRSASQQEESEAVSSLRNVSAYYGIETVDMAAAFETSGYEYSELTDDDGSMNDLGHEVYLQALVELIDAQVEADTGKMSELEDFILPYDDGIELFDRYASYDTAKTTSGTKYFVREDETTWVMTLGEEDSPVYGLMGLDYTCEPGETSAEIYMDGELASTLTQVLDENAEAQERVDIACERTVAGSEVRIVFADKEQADGFNGVCFSWGTDESYLLELLEEEEEEETGEEEEETDEEGTEGEEEVGAEENVAETGTGADSETDSGTESDSELSTEVNAASDAESDAEADAESEPETETQAETGA